MSTKWKLFSISHLSFFALILLLLHLINLSEGSVRSLIKTCVSHFETRLCPPWSPETTLLLLVSSWLQRQAGSIRNSGDLVEHLA